MGTSLQMCIQHLLSQSCKSNSATNPKRQQALKPAEIRRVNVDTTVQEKAIAFPTDARLSRGRHNLVPPSFWR
jgi:hypothetical protein